MDKTIIAIATPIGESSIGVVRISGKSTFELLAQCFRSNTNVEEMRGNTIYYGKIVDPMDNNIFDEVLVSVFKSPNSYTGEDITEISTHGNPFILKSILDLFLRLGAVMAEPGEFTLRAYLNGKIDLTRAEAVNDLIRAHTKYAHANAINRLEGKFYNVIENIHTAILDLLAMIEVAIDHSDEDLDFENYDDFRTRTQAIIDEISKLLSTARAGKMLTNGIKVAIIGAPNTGKSSLMNTLLQKDRVIVSDIAGTTRDTVEAELNICGIPVVIIDTAGVRQTVDHIERLGIERTSNAIRNADLRLMLFDSTRELSREDMEILEIVKKFDTIYLLNKTDLKDCVLLANDTSAHLKDNFAIEPIFISAETGAGIETIEHSIRDFYFSFGVNPDNDVMVVNIRQEGLLTDTARHLEYCIKAIDEQLSEEFLAAHIRDARVSLEAITGKTTDDAILDRIFSQFCVGK